MIVCVDYLFFMCGKELINDICLVVILLCMTKRILIDGLAVDVTRKRIKRMNMRIHEPDGRVTVSAPYIVSDREIIAFVRSKRAWIDRGIERVRSRAEKHPEPLTPEEKEARRARLKERISVRLPEIEKRTGLRANGWTVRDMHTRWGSCNTRTHHLNFSLMLATRTDRELDYVILHELVHTVVPGHGRDFYEGNLPTGMS